MKNHSFYQIASDEGALNKPVELSKLLITSGQRAKVLVKVDKPGEYRLLNLPYNRGNMGMMGNNDSKEWIALATIDYKSSIPTIIPSKLASISKLPKPEVVRRFELNHGMNPTVSMAFLTCLAKYGASQKR